MGTLIKKRIKAESKFEYKNKYRDKAQSFSPAGDEVVASFAASDVGDELLRAGALGDVAQLQSANMDRRFAVLRTDAASDSQSVLEDLRENPNIANVLPVLIDEHGSKRYFVPDEFTLQFNDGVSTEEAERAIRELGSEVVTKQRTPGYFTLSVPEGRGLFETLGLVSNDARVKFAEPSEFGIDDRCGVSMDGAALPMARGRSKRIADLKPRETDAGPGAIRQAEGLAQGAAVDSESYIPDDANFGQLWGLRNIGQVVNGVAGSVDADIDAPEAWDYTRGRRDVIVAVIDTGCDMNHPDIAANILARGGEDWDFADAGDGVPDDMDSHGTHVCGTCVAVDNATGVIGVAPGCQVMPLRVNLTTGMNANRADAINYVAAQAVAHPARRYVINCSWKMNGDHAGVHSAIVNARDHNVVVCFAAGNAAVDIDVTPQFPAVYPEVIAVAAIDQRDHVASFSNFGTKVDVSAPGVNVFSTIPDDTHSFLDGTSMASPHAAATAALIWSFNKQLSAAQVRSLLEGNCDSIDAKNPGFGGKLGKGRINAYRSVRATPAPTIAFSPIGHLPFPQANAGSSTGLHFVRTFSIAGLRRPVLMFLTQQAGAERIYYLNPATGAVLGSVLPAGNTTVGTLEWDGRHIQVANVTVGSGSINAIHPTTGAQVGTLPVPAGRGEALAIVGADYYYSTISRIHRIRRSTGAVLSSFVPPGGACHGLTYGGGLLFSVNATTGQINAFDPVTLIVKGRLTAPGAAPGTHGLAYDAVSRRLYVANQGANRVAVLQLAI